MCQVSFVVPALNEGRHIRELFQNVTEITPPGVSWELVVVDNGSTDDTLQIAASLPNTVGIQARGTVGACRNAGVARARGSVLAFLDADIRLTTEWRASIESVLERLVRDERIVTGSTVSVPDDPTCIERYWFAPMCDRPRQYINSAHLIVTRTLFDRVGGFDESLRTGEDFDFSERARRAGAQIVSDNRLRAIHLGFPRTLREFANREMWHGQGDAGTLKRFLASRVAITSVVFSALLVGGVIAAIATHSWLPLLVALVACVGIAGLSALKRTGFVGIASLFVNTALYHLYFLCRTAALVRSTRSWRQT
jgi:hypothetical protein